MNASKLHYIVKRWHGGDCWLPETLSPVASIAGAREAIELCCLAGDRVRIVAHNSSNGSDTVVVHSRAARHTDRLTHPVLSK